MNAKVKLLTLLPLLAGCVPAYGASVGVRYEPVSDAHYYEQTYGGGTYDYQFARRVNYGRLPVPRNYVPAPGRCRVWLPGVAPGRQPRSGSCRAMERRVPRGGWLLVRPLRSPEVVELISYDHRRPTVRTRYAYDVRTRRRVNGYF